MVKKITQLENVSASDLTRSILDGVEQKIKALEQRLTSKEPPEFLDRKQVAKFLGVSLVTVHEWSKKGILVPFKIGNRVRYKREDIIATMERSRES
ncbi:helix-turn-helix domain-containing protein [Maribacter luteus]|uniref:Helix-turn-helix domain-containing protein n=1 Tax=Maribacter luteus TaxID=2594478 RepID=A0A6I2MTF3_9FLAO|nr:helix-turn-helix domain-containing protein [Maribacter luteus]MRX65760.1 helix-turn-helix domain-containing protein [Maribacter luteus]